MGELKGVNERVSEENEEWVMDFGHTSGVTFLDNLLNPPHYAMSFSRDAFWRCGRHREKTTKITPYINHLCVSWHLNTSPKGVLRPQVHDHI